VYITVTNSAILYRIEMPRTLLSSTRLPVTEFLAFRRARVGISWVRDSFHTRRHAVRHAPWYACRRCSRCQNVFSTENAEFAVSLAHMTVYTLVCPQNASSLSESVLDAINCVLQIALHKTPRVEVSFIYLSSSWILPYRSLFIVHRSLLKTYKSLLVCNLTRYLLVL